MTEDHVVVLKKFVLSEPNDVSSRSFAALTERLMTRAVTIYARCAGNINMILKDFQDSLLLDILLDNRMEAAQTHRRAA